MISFSSGELHSRAKAFAANLNGAEIIEGSSLIGGGATPQQALPSWLIVVQCRDVVDAERRLRLNGRLLFDLRTVFPAEEDELASAILAAAG